jgi:hypothetical protein
MPESSEWMIPPQTRPNGTASSQGRSVREGRPGERLRPAIAPLCESEPYVAGQFRLGRPEERLRPPTVPVVEQLLVPARVHGVRMGLPGEKLRPALPQS